MAAFVADPASGGSGGDEAARASLPPAAFAGPVGEWVLAAAPHTEADPAALLVSTLVACGVVVGHQPHLWAGDSRQTASLFAVVVADTPKANRGLSWAVTRRLLDVVDPELLRRQTRTGLGTGRPLLDTLHAAALPDRHYPDDRPADPTRVLVHDPTLTASLGLAGRASSELPLLLRSAWDGQIIEFDRGRRRVERHHVGVVAHATADQLAQRLSLTGPSVSFVNRFVFAVARRQRPLVDEGNVPPELLVEHGRRLRDNLRTAAGFGTVPRSAAADQRWRVAYPGLADDDPGGLLGVMVARAARHVLRFALVHALADASPTIEPRHLDAALALWSYCRQSAAAVASTTPSTAGDLTGDLLAALEAAGERGLSLSEQLDHFYRNIPAGRLRAARRVLEEAGLAVSVTERRAGQGRSATVTRVVHRRASGS